MKWVVIGGVALGCMLSGVLGLTMGINLNPESTVRFVPNWGSLGDWVSGIGALCAVVVSLWLARRSEELQAKREEEHIKIEQSASKLFASVRVISLGHYPVTIKNVLVTRPDGGAFPLPASAADGGGERDLLQYPKKLEFREDAHLGWSVTNAKGLLHRIQFLEVERLSDLKIEVWTTIGQHQAPLSEEIIQFLREVARSSGIALTPPI